MIHIDRNNIPVPKVLMSTRIERDLSRMADLLSRSEEHIDQLRFKSSPEYTRARPALMELFHSKCAYCESPLGATGAADVEHFRPKQRAEDLDGRIDPAHYAWLAYDWENLLIACAACNRRTHEDGQLIGKANLFPVAKRRAPHMAGVDECRRIEGALLLDPCFDQPEEHLDFDGKGFCVPLTHRGTVTIDVIGLNRRGLVEARHQTWERTLLELKALFSDQSLKPKDRGKRLQVIQADERPYAATVRAAVKYAMNELSSSIGVDPTSDEAEGVAPEDIAKHSEKLNPEAISGAMPPPPELVTSQDALPSKRRRRARRELPRYAHDSVSRIEIRNFKVIQSLDLDVPTLMPDDPEKAGALMLLGENATGKSTVLEALAMTLVGSEQLDRLKLPATASIHRSDWEKPLKEEEPTSVVVTLDSGKQLELHIDPGNPKFVGNEKPSSVLLGYGPRRFFPKQRKLRRSDHPGERLRTMFDPLALVPNPRAWLMNCPKWKFNATVRALREILLLPDEALVTRPRRGQRRGKQVMFDIQGDSAPLDRLSDGYKTIVATSVDIMREMLDYYEDLESATGVVLIDELETHLHPRWKMRIARSMREAMPNVQFIFTSHDPVCLRGMKNGEVRVMFRDDTGVDQFSELPNVEGLSIEQLLTSDFFGLHSAEDPDLETDMARYATLVGKRDRSIEDEQEISEHREQLRHTMILGETPQEQVMHEAMSEFKLKHAAAMPPKRKDLKEETVKEILEIWASIDTGDIES